MARSFRCPSRAIAPTTGTRLAPRRLRGVKARCEGGRCAAEGSDAGRGKGRKAVENKRKHELRVRLALPPGGRSRRAAWPGAVRARPFRREGGAGEGRGRLKGCAQGQAEGRGSEGAAVKGVGSWKERRGTFCVECSLGGGPCGRQRRARLWEGHQKGMSTAVGRGWGEGALSARARSARPTSSTRPVAAATYRLAPRGVSFLPRTAHADAHPSDRALAFGTRAA